MSLNLNSYYEAVKTVVSNWYYGPPPPPPVVVEELNLFFTILKGITGNPVTTGLGLLAAAAGAKGLHTLYNYRQNPYLNPQQDLNDDVYNIIKANPDALKASTYLRVVSEKAAVALLNQELVAKIFAKMGPAQAKSVAGMTSDVRLKYLQTTQKSVADQLKQSVTGKIGRINAPGLGDNLLVLAFVDGLSELQLGEFKNLFNNLTPERLAEHLVDKLEDSPNLFEKEKTDLIKLLATFDASMEIMPKVRPAKF